MPKLSIIIPTHKRASILERCLECIARQTAAADIEVIVVMDGPDVKTTAMLGKQRLPMSLRSLTVPKSHQGVARNAGMAQVKTEYVMFIGDDILLDSHACERHLQAHEKYSEERSIAVLGFTTWDPAVGITPVMQWLERSGWQFGYPAIAPYAHDIVPQDIQHKFTYTSHISLSSIIAGAFPFRDDVQLYGWEDIEWGMRLAKEDVSLFYEPGATAFHHHRMTLEESLERMRILGKSAVQLKNKVPELDRVPTGLKLLKYRVASLLPTMDGKHRKAFLEGMAEAK